MTDKYQKLLSLTRASDWRFSFIPHIFGNLYLWFIILEIPFSANAIILLILSLITSFGFAALGYFINEFFDKVDDAKAGKINKVALLKKSHQFILFVIILLCTFLPWLWIPWNEVSVALILIQIALFLIYSVPPLRFKKVPVLSGVVDAGYAYILPMALSFYSFALFSGTVQHVGFILAYAALLLFTGFRNITIHHINDIFKDKRIGLHTLPRILGIQKTSLFLKLLLTLEFVLIVFVIFLLIEIKTAFIITFLPLITVIWHTISVYTKVENKIIVYHPIRHATDSFYQIWLPAIVLIVLIYTELSWFFLLPFHAILFVPKGKVKGYSFWVKFQLRQLWYYKISPFLSLLVNFPIYLFFLMFGVNLKKEQKSALEYLKDKFSHKK